MARGNAPSIPSSKDEATPETLRPLSNRQRDITGRIPIGPASVMEHSQRVPRFSPIPIHRDNNAWTELLAAATRSDRRRRRIRSGAISGAPILRTKQGTAISSQVEGLPRFGQYLGASRTNPCPRSDKDLSPSQPPLKYKNSPHTTVATVRLSPASFVSLA
jgi:hypothetical protein